MCDGNPKIKVNQMTSTTEATPTEPAEELLVLFHNWLARKKELWQYVLIGSFSLFRVGV